MATGLNTGQDCTIDFVSLLTGQTYSFSTPSQSTNLGGDLLNFEVNFDTDIIRRRPMNGNGLAKRRIDYKGCKGTIEIGRVNADFEQLMLNAQAIYRSGGDPETFTIHRTVQERDGSGAQSVFRYDNCTMWMSKGPGFTMGEDVKMTLEFEGDDANRDQ